MRVYLVNHIFHKLKKKKVPKKNILFISLHGDALHSSLRGAMVYYPDRRLRRGMFGLKHKIYRKRKEYNPSLTYKPSDNLYSEKLSKSFGKIVINEFRKSKLPTHRVSSAVRGYLYRKGRKTLGPREQIARRGNCSKNAGVESADAYFRRFERHGPKSRCSATASVESRQSPPTRRDSTIGIRRIIRKMNCHKTDSVAYAHTSHVLAKPSGFIASFEAAGVLFFLVELQCTIVSQLSESDFVRSRPPM